MIKLTDTRAARLVHLILRVVKHKHFYRPIFMAGLLYAFFVGFFLRNVLLTHSYLEIFPRELIFPFAMHAVTATSIALIFYWLPWLQSYGSKLIAGLLFSLYITGYEANLKAVSGFIRAFTPGVTENDTLALISFLYLLILFVLSVLIGVIAEKTVTRMDRIKHRDVAFGVIILVAYISLIPIVSFAQILPKMIDQTNTQASTLPAPKNTVPPTEKPDIYYIVLDRYTSNKVLAEQFNYKNDAFSSMLKDNGYYINDNAQSNYPYTTISLSSTLNADYTNSNVEAYKDDTVQSRALYHNLIRQSSVVKALKQQGYQYLAIGSEYGASYKSPLADRDYMIYSELKGFGKKKKLRGIEAIEFANSPYYQFALQLGWFPLRVNDHTRRSDVRTQLDILTAISSDPQQGGRFIFAHILVPHDPFIFNVDGSSSAYSGVDGLGKPVKEKYIGQVEFINSQLTKIIQSIQKNSNGSAVVLLNADEGPYPQNLNDTFMTPQSADTTSLELTTTEEDMTSWTKDWLEMKFGIQQAVHIPKATAEDLSNLSSVNMFRIVLNRYAGYELPYLPDCKFGFTKGSRYEFNYANITDAFTELPDARCAEFESLPK